MAKKSINATMVRRVAEAADGYRTGRPYLSSQLTSFRTTRLSLKLKAKPKSSLTYHRTKINTRCLALT
jgi:hypothetical protein